MFYKDLWENGKVPVNALLCVQAIYLYELNLLHESEILQGKLH